MSKPAWVVLFAAVFSIAVWLRVTNPAVTGRSPDERYYMVYAGKVLEAPLDAPRNLVREYNLSPTMWTYPIPLRIAYYYSIAAIVKTCGLTPEKAGLALSTGSSILQLAMVALVGLRFFNCCTALTALALLSVSPQDLAMSRRVWGDGVSGSAAMILLWLCAEISVRPRAKFWFIPLWLCSAYFLLLKESGGVFFGICILGLMIQSWRQDRSWKRQAWIIAGAVGTAIYSFVIMADLCGGVLAALETARHSAQSAPTNIYGALYQNGPWYSLPLGLWVLSPLAAIGCCVGLVALLPPRNTLGNALALNQRQYAMAVGMGALIILVIAAVTMPPALKNLRYISFIVGPWYLLAALGLSSIAAHARNIMGARAAVPIAGVAALLVLYSCWSDYSRYRELFIERNILDLNIRQVVTTPFEPAS